MEKVQITSFKYKESPDKPLNYILVQICMLNYTFWFPHTPIMQFITFYFSTQVEF
jgi:hypothetical protein